MLGSCCGEAAPQRGDRPAADARVDDFQDVDTRLSFHLATPVLDVIGWPLQIVGRPTGDQIPVDDNILATTVAPALH